MAQRTPSDHPLRDLFQRVLRRAFREHRELYSPDIESHLGDNVLGEFVHSDHLYRLRNLRGQRLRDLPRMLEVAHEEEGPERRLEVDGYIGDFVLFMGGFFPQTLRRSRWLGATPMVSRVGSLMVRFSRPYDYYLAEGRNAYSRAAATARIFDPEVQRTYERLGSHLEEYLEVVSLTRKLLQSVPSVRELEGGLD